MSLLPGWRRCLLLILLLPVLSAAPAGAGTNFPGANDHIFPPAPAARPFIRFDGRGFWIRGKRTFVAAGDLHYSRMPRALWRDRLLRIKRAGYNTVQTYTFWNYHETYEGRWDFSGDKDLDAYLKLIHQLGMYAIVRLGPYVNAEWDSGGWPVWLRFKPGLIVREDNAPYLKYMDRWLDHLMPILAANQINRGGPIVMVQLENEDVRGAGTDLPNPYFIHLRDKVVALGLQVPYFFSGLNHGDNPAGETPWDYSSRDSPWYSTEFWTGWIDFYGVDPNRAQRVTRNTWKVLAYGGSGYTHYTIAGGTDFDNWSCDEQGTSYDFGAPIGQAGDLRADYYGVKQAALFATTFSDILDDAQNATDQFQGAATGSIRITARKSPNGTILFLDNSQGTAATTQVKVGTALLPTAGPMSMAAGEIIPIVEDTPLCPHVRIGVAAARILGASTHGRTTTLVLYGPPGDPAEVHFGLKDGVRPEVLARPARAGVPPLTVAADQLVLQTRFPATDPDEFLFRAGDQTVRVLAVSTNEADRTWFVDDGNRSLVVCGPDYVGEVQEQHGRLRLQIEQRAGNPLRNCFLYDDRSSRILKETVLPPRPAGTRVPVLSAWSAAAGNAEAMPAWNDAAWLSSPTPLPMGADGDVSAYAWYRCHVHADRPGSYGLNLSDAGDWVSVFVNGVHQDSSAVQRRFDNPIARVLKLTLAAGDNTIALLTAHYGRAKLHAYIGPIDTLDSKGIRGDVMLSMQPGQAIAVSRWRWKADDRGEAGANEMAAPTLSTDGSDWQSAAIGQDVFQGRIGFAWFRTTLDSLSGPHRQLHFSGVDDNGIVYLNGKKLKEHQGFNEPFDVSLDNAWQDKGPNALAVLVQNTTGPGGILGAVQLQKPSEGGQTPVRNWKMQGGLALPADNAPDWRPLPAAAPAADGPAFYRATFRVTPPGPVGPHPVLRIAAAGLSRGFVWLNGHNLGRYPERSAVYGLYVPDCWLQPGLNTVVVFDEDGQPPVSAQLVEETVASRDGMELEPDKPVGRAREAAQSVPGH